jgi:hypothetical protein
MALASQPGHIRHALQDFELLIFELLWRQRLEQERVREAAVMQHSGLSSGLCGVAGCSPTVRFASCWPPVMWQGRWRARVSSSPAV